MSFAEKFAKAYKSIVPSPFTIALILTGVTFLLALLFTRPANMGVMEHVGEITSHWQEGLWNKSEGGIYFAFQMMFMLVFGHIIALSKPISKLIDVLISPCTNSANTAFIVTFSTIIISMFNWGLGLIFGAILARKIGEKFKTENRPLNYPLIGASAYVGLMVWHGGFSGSAPIKAAEQGNLTTLVAQMENVELSVIPHRVLLSDTLFSSMNITVTILLLVLLPIAMYFAGKYSKPSQKLPKKITTTQIESIQVWGAEKLDYSSLFSKIIGALFIGYAGYLAFIEPDQPSLKIITPNFINFTLFGLAILLHKNLSQFLNAAGKAISDATGILLQFPLYFGILGIMIGSGLINQITDAFVNLATTESFPIYNFLSAGIVNIFVPSGGGQWVVQGPIIIAAAQELGVDYSKSIMALAYGDQLTNMIQPFWALPLLGITGLKAKEILPYTLILFLLGLLIFCFGLLVF